jgi:hypothetical protein
MYFVAADVAFAAQVVIGTLQTLISIIGSKRALPTAIAPNLRHSLWLLYLLTWLSPLQRMVLRMYFLTMNIAFIAQIVVCACWTFVPFTTRKRVFSTSITNYVSALSETCST